MAPPPDCSALALSHAAMQESLHVPSNGKAPLLMVDTVALDARGSNLSSQPLGLSDRPTDIPYYPRDTLEGQALLEIATDPGQVSPEGWLSRRVGGHGPRSLSTAVDRGSYEAPVATRILDSRC